MIPQVTQSYLSGHRLPLVRRQIGEGLLEWILPQCAVDEDGLFFYYPRRASLAPKLRAFIDVAKASLSR